MGVAARAYAARSALTANAIEMQVHVMDAGAPSLAAEIALKPLGIKAGSSSAV